MNEPGDMNCDTCGKFIKFGDACWFRFDPPGVYCCEACYKQLSLFSAN